VTLKIARIKKKILRTTGNFPRCTPVRDLHTALNLPYVYDYVKKKCAGDKQKLNKFMRMNMSAA
jgi:hypothetical protein